MSTFGIVILCIWSIVAAFWSWSNYLTSRELRWMTARVCAMSRKIESLEYQSLREKARALNSPTARRQARERRPFLHALSKQVRRSYDS